MALGLPGRVRPHYRSQSRIEVEEHRQRRNRYRRQEHVEDKK